MSVERDFVDSSVWIGDTKSKSDPVLDRVRSGRRLILDSRTGRRTCLSRLHRHLDLGTSFDEGSNRGGVDGIVRFESGEKGLEIAGKKLPALGSGADGVKDAAIGLRVEESLGEVMEVEDAITKDAIDYRRKVDLPVQQQLYVIFLNIKIWLQN